MTWYHPALAPKTINYLDEEISELRKAMGRIQDVLQPADNAENADTVGRAREIAKAALNRR